MLVPTLKMLLVVTTEDDGEMATELLVVMTEDDGDTATELLVERVDGTDDVVARQAKAENVSK